MLHEVWATPPQASPPQEAMAAPVGKAVEQGGGNPALAEAHQPLFELRGERETPGGSESRQAKEVSCAPQNLPTAFATVCVPLPALQAGKAVEAEPAKGEHLHIEIGEGASHQGPPLGDARSDKSPSPEPGEIVRGEEFQETASGASSVQGGKRRGMKLRKRRPLLDRLVKPTRLTRLSRRLASLLPRKKRVAERRPPQPGAEEDGPGDRDEGKAPSEAPSGPSAPMLGRAAEQGEERHETTLEEIATRTRIPGGPIYDPEAPGDRRPSPEQPPPPQWQSPEEAEEPQIRQPQPDPEVTARVRIVTRRTPVIDITGEGGVPRRPLVRPQTPDVLRRARTLAGTEAPDLQALAAENAHLQDRLLRGVPPEVMRQLDAQDRRIYREEKRAGIRRAKDVDTQARDEYYAPDAADRALWAYACIPQEGTWI